MTRTRTIKLALVAVVVAVTIGVGADAAVTAAASGSTTYFACLKSGKLTSVGTSAPTCASGATQIQWDSPGTPGTPGATGPQGPVGQASVVNFPDTTACPVPGPVTAATLPLAYLDIPSIQGESTATGYANQISVLSWSLGATGSGGGGTCGSGASGTGTGASARDLTVIKEIDKATPLLMAASVRGTSIPAMTLHVTRSTGGGAPSEFLTFTFRSVVVRSISWSHDDESPKEAVTIGYGDLQVSYTQDLPTGGTAPPVVTCYDFVNQLPC